jgi:phosphate/sulfate permease
MENYYIIIVVILFALAISDLIVGVGNDAVNFLNSAIGSKAGSFKVIMVVAALGVMLGAAFSSGMMEVARNGIFHPQHFYFNEIMIIFLAVMLTDIILLDLFNTFGMPTSTTVSIVFELLGSALAVSLIKISNSPDALSIAEYINTSKALAIISAILLSVAISFVAGAIIQYLVRLLFSFEYTQRFKYLGSIFGGIAITSITYFMLIKGLKDSIFADYLVLGEPLKDFVKHRSTEIILYSALGWTIILQVLRWIFRIDILKTIVFVGTFALAMAFAGNDLVNFIGVPLAGYEAFMQFTHQPDLALPANDFLMGGLSEKVQTPVYFLIISGVVMVLTLAFSKKAKTVVKTSVDLSRQDEGEEKFGASPIARGIIKQTVAASEFMTKILPAPLNNFVDRQFDQKLYNKRMKALGKEAPAFDMLRASVNLIISAVLIAYATSNKLPLSTTYVTFMVAMGTSLSDRAWGRESAVFRITGVLLVILGWFFTALVALTISFIIAYFLYYTGSIGILVMVLLLIFIIWKSNKSHKKITVADGIAQSKINDIETLGVIESCKSEISSSLNDFDIAYKGLFNSLFVEDTKQLKKYRKNVLDLNKKAKKLKKDMHKTVSKIQEDSEDAGHYYIQVLDYLREMAHNQEFASNIMLEHLENKHKSLTHDQIEELRKLKKLLSENTQKIRTIILESTYSEVDSAIAASEGINLLIAQMSKQQVKRIKSEQASSKASLLYLALIHESKNYNLHSVNLLKSHRDFITKG